MKMMMMMMMMKKKKKKKKKKKRKDKCYTCGVEEHYAAECEKSMYRPMKSANMIEADGRTSGNGNLLLTVLLVCHTSRIT